MKLMWFINMKLKQKCVGNVGAEMRIAYRWDGKWYMLFLLVNILIAAIYR